MVQFHGGVEGYDALCRFFQCNFKLFCNASGLSIRTPKYLNFFHLVYNLISILNYVVVFLTNISFQYTLSGFSRRVPKTKKQPKSVKSCFQNIVPRGPLEKTTFENHARRTEKFA